ncbi:MAG: sulfotransferase [Alphaproteobacteria bacterium]|nr:sulfotransferase [Alphaproteobacteria bacterium]MCB9699666.1 sulfotransferase [Alphaproteobacteria bacterium]
MPIGFDVQKRWSTDQLIHGIEAQDFVKLLQKNNWRVDPVYLHRLAMVGGLSVPATMLGRLEDMRFGRALSTQEIDPEPLFAIGHWRSGTTHLHNLLGRLPGFTYPTVMQVIFPTCFLSADSFLPQLTGRMLDGTRTYDNVKQGWYEAAEDEIALAKLTGKSPYLAFMFPEQSAKYERYVDFLECSQAEKDEWKDAFRYLIKKIMLQTRNKRVVVKSCTHTARIRMILEMFPNAKFVHIHRNPYEVFASTLHMRSHTDWENFFHLPDVDPEVVRKNQTLELGQRIYERVIEDKHLVPEENWFEMGYADLVGNEVDVIGRIFEQFGYDGWDRSKRVLEEYLDGVKGYQRNQLKMDKRLKEDVYAAWRPAFEAFGYDKD